ncbi:MAG: hypothetical protein JO352_05220 [Chloroflexi bacterium]|nr:hypothetical protein [Chloroflexota bacterium]MBV9602196.1 hypothetical protein [Chloroflexota bacterium]
MLDEIAANSADDQATVFELVSLLEAATALGHVGHLDFDEASVVILDPG